MSLSSLPRPLLLTNGYLRCYIKRLLSSSIPSDISYIIAEYILLRIAWDHTKCGKDVTFIDEFNILVGSTVTADTNICMCCANYTIEAAKHSTFSWTVKVEEISTGSWIGFIKAPLVTNMDFNSHLRLDPHPGHCFGFTHDSNYIYFEDSLSKHLTDCSVYLPINPETEKGYEIVVDDEFRMEVDFVKHEIEIFYNNVSVGIGWKNIPDKILPAVCNNRTRGGFRISSKYFVFI